MKNAQKKEEEEEINKRVEERIKTEREEEMKKEEQIKKEEEEKVKEEQKTKEEEIKKEEEMKKEEEHKGTAAGAQQDDKQKKVHFEEQKNEQRDVSKDPSKSIQSPTQEQPRPQVEINTGAVPLSALAPNTELFILRTTNKIVLEGPISKRMLFFSCFWHKRYFVLTNDGMLCYFRALNGRGKGKLNLRHVNDVRRINEETSGANKYKIILRYNGYTESIRFDDERVRDHWNNKIREVRDTLNG
ncbi:putative Pleckstrin like-type, Pleckstrin like domain protein [Trachipleistophora hominis]|uniref:Putative Pleckstrin like-type, Pleckstrin like domain protein n=1 Tax=Trachipleistophora hominis TaxID=72359 RepID=L7JZA2_TRAHO|nr:putative Pleckstrin like-type, Pleckstrin like domain protein [Trachipleistophora hominis]